MIEGKFEEETFDINRTSLSGGDFRQHWLCVRFQGCEVTDVLLGKLALSIRLPSCHS